MPPLAEAVAVPVAEPLQVAFVFVVFTVNNVGSVIITVFVATQLFASCTVAVYVPAGILEMTDVVTPPEDHK